MEWPKFLNLTQKELETKVRQAQRLLAPCQVCPRKCGVNRSKNEKGFCRLGAKAMVSSFSPHFGEEACLVGKNGSGTIFFTYCNLSCVYCQNYDISQLGHGKEVSDKELAGMMLALQKIGCHNINLVSPTSHVPQILVSLLLAIQVGLKIPLVYNTNGYDSVQTLKILDGVIDIYMPDFKYSDENSGIKYSQAPKYFEIAKKAIKEMHKQVGDLKIDGQGLAKRGLLVRHLVLPNELSGSEKIIKFLVKEVSKNTFINIMAQYYPCWQAQRFPELNQPTTREEYKQVVASAKKHDLLRQDTC